MSGFGISVMERRSDLSYDIIVVHPGIDLIAGSSALRFLGFGCGVPFGQHFDFIRTYSP